MQARVRVLDEQEHRLLRRACSDVAAVLLSEVVGGEVEAEVDAQVRALWAAQLHTQVEEAGVSTGDVRRVPISSRM